MAARSLPSVLVVDDEKHSVAAMRMALEDDFHVLEALNAAEALTRLIEDLADQMKRRRKRPDALIETDLPDEIELRGYIYLLGVEEPEQHVGVGDGVVLPPQRRV